MGSSRGFAPGATRMRDPLPQPRRSIPLRCDQVRHIATKPRLAPVHFLGCAHDFGNGGFTSDGFIQAVITHRKKFRID